MLAPEIPLDEAARLAELDKYQLLDSDAELEFDHLTSLMASSFGAPIALISLIDSHRQWFLSRQGLEVCSTSRQVSFCGHAILDNDVFYVEDATQDERFYDNPLVTGEPHIRTYAGAPIISPQGFKLGTTCLIFTQMTPLSATQLHQLADFARVASDMIEMRLDRLYYRAQQMRLQQLVAVLGHELRTPLASLKMMQDQSKLDQCLPLGREMVETTEHLQTITADIEALALGREKQVAMARARPFETVEKVINSLAPLLDERGISYELRADTLASEAAMLDTHGLRQVLTNLIRNAALHSQATELRAELSCELKHDLYRYQLLIIDNGKGIPEDDRTRIFDPYQRGQSHSPGSGLGLAVCREIVQRMEGSVDVSPTPGGGTTFHLKFSAEPAMEVAPRPQIDVGDRNVLRGLRILLVEDTRMLRILGEVLLKRAGAEVVLAENGVEALAQLGRSAFDYILCDFVMPGMAGDELTQLARERYPHIPVIILSSISDQQQIERLIQMGALGVLPKPFDIRRLTELLIANRP